MRRIAGMGASACLALALAGCANKCGVERIDCAPTPSVVAQTALDRSVSTGGCPAVAVMPFIGITEDPACGLLVANVMANELGNCEDCFVVAPETVTTKLGVKPGEAWDPVEAGRKIGAPYILTGRVTDYMDIDEDDMEPMVGVAVRLIETGTGRVVWTGNASKSAPELPEGGIVVLTSGVCGDLAQTIHDNMDKVAVPPAPTAKPSVIVADKVEKPEPPLDVVESETAVVESEEEEIAIESARRLLGEGTADWAVPLEDMPEYLKALASGKSEFGAEGDAEDVLTVRETDASLHVAEAVSATFGSEEEKDIVPGAVLVPGAVTLDFPDENLRPDDFGVQAENDDAPSTPGPIGEAYGVVAESSGSQSPSRTVAPLEAGRMLDRFEDMSAAPVSLDASTSDIAPVSYQPLVDDEEEDNTDDMSIDAFSTQFTVDYTLELEEDEDTAEEESPVSDDELDFFGSLSDSLFKDLGDS